MDVSYVQSLGDEVDSALDVDPEDVPVQLVEAEGKVPRHALVQQDRVHLVPANVQSVALKRHTVLDGTLLDRILVENGTHLRKLGRNQIKMTFLNTGSIGYIDIGYSDTV